MPTSDKTVKVRLVAVSDGFVKGTAEASAATRKLGGDLDNVSSKTKGVEAGMGKASAAVKGLAIAGAAVAGTELVRFLGDAVNAASDLGETTSKVAQIFGQDALPALEKFANTAADALGQSKQQALDAAATFGIFGKSAGLTGQSLVDFSTKMTGLAGDLASFANTSPEDAITAIGAALRGESEPIRQYGVLLDDATLRQSALKLGIIKTTNEALTPQQRVLAAQAEIIRQTSDAQGDFARTSDGLANQQRILTAELENAKAELGQALLPVVLDVTKALRSGLDVVMSAAHAWGELPGPLKAAIAAFVVWKITNEKVVSGLGSTRDAIRRMRDELALQQALAGGITGGYRRLGDEAKTTGAKVSQASLALGVAGKAAKGAGSALLGAFGGPVGLAIAGITVAIGVFAAKQAESKARVDELTASLDQQTGAITEQTRVIAAKQLQDEGLLEVARKLGVSQKLVVEAYTGSADALAELERMQAGAARRSDELSGKTKDLTERLDTGAGVQSSWAELTGKSAQAASEQDAGLASLVGRIRPVNEQMALLSDKQREVGSAAGVASDAQADFTQTTKDAGKAVEDEKKKAQEAAQAILDLADAHLAAVDAEVGYQQALDDTDAAIKENGKTATKNKQELNLTTEAGRANAKALLDQAAKAKEVAKSNLEQGDSLKSLRAGMADAREKFIENAQKMGLSKDAAKKMADEFGLTKGEVDNLAKAVDGLPASKQIKVEADTAAAKAELERLKTLLAGLNSKSLVIDVTTRQRYVTERTPNGGRNLAGGLTKADGGYISGPGTSRSDSIPAWLSNGEYVIKAAAVAKYGTTLLDHINGMRFADGGAVRFAPQPRVIVAPSGPTMHTERYDQPITIGTLVAADVQSFRREAERRRANAYQRNARAS